MTIGSVLARLFSDPWDRPVSDMTRREPRLTGAPSRQDNTAVTANPAAALPALPPPGEPSAAARYDLRNVSPRQFADITHEMYMEGSLSWDEFKMVGFPSELDPRYDQTIGALTGEKAKPDTPRDMLAQWEHRVDFEQRYNPDTDQVRIAESVLQKLSWQAQTPVRLSA